MSRFVNRDARDTVTLANGDRVYIRQALTAPEAADLKRRLFDVQVDMATGSARIADTAWQNQELEVVRAYVLGWDFKDDGGNPVLFSVEMIDQLEDATVSEIAAGINQARLARREAAEKKAGGA